MNINSCWLPAVLVCGVSIAWAQQPPRPQFQGPAETVSRSQGQNFKDLALSSCIASAYAIEPKAASDAGATAAVLDTLWTSQEPQLASAEVAKLVDSYLKREYASTESSRIRLDLLKCLDLYHSKELDRLSKRLVASPSQPAPHEGGPSRK